MELRHWTGLLRLMSLMVVADSHIREEEIRVFVFRMRMLRNRLAKELMFSEGLVRDWFEAHAEELTTDLKLHPEAATDEALASLDDFPKHKDLVEALNAVARADGERHASELDIIARAAERWGMRVPKK